MTTVYRQAHAFPPGEGSYVSVMERRGGKSFGKEILDQAGSGLSVIGDLDSARQHARAFRKLGHILVRYHIPDEAIFSLNHFVGADYHLTLTMERLTDLAKYLDTEWWEVQDFSTTQ